MKLPNADKAIIDSKKIKEYCLNPEHPRGKHKAKIFQSSLDFTSEDTAELIYEITKNLPELECRQGQVDEYGQRYMVDIEIERNGFRAIIRTGWIIKRNETQPRLTTCFVK